MQMYKVSFRSQGRAVIETGSFLVCATDKDNAETLVAAYAEIPASSTSFDTVRVKPSIYELSRSEFNVVHTTMASASNDDEQTGAVHEIRASAKVYGYSNNSVVRRFAASLVESVAVKKAHLAKHTTELSVEIERADHRPRPSRVEENSIFKEKRFFAGGAGRPR